MNYQPLEQDIYNKRIAELMKKKTSLIESLNRLLEATSKSGARSQEQTGVPLRSLSVQEHQVSE